MCARNAMSWPMVVLLTAAAVVASAGENQVQVAGQDAVPTATLPVGVARIDVTPDYPVRLTGYGGRATESQGVAQRLWAKALAIGGDEGDGPAVLLCVDNCGVPAGVTAEVASRLKVKASVEPERLVVCSTHTHTGPWLKGFLPLHFVEPLPAEHQQHIARYTRQLTDWLEQAALEALCSRKPGRLAWAQGRVSFAANRRVLKKGKWAGFGVNPNGPVDHSLPTLRVTDRDGKLVAVVVNYACHCTTLTGRHTRIHGDWAGSAQQFIEADHPGAIAMVCIGCAGDANPEPRGKEPMTDVHGRAVAEEVNRLLRSDMTPIEPRLTTRTVRVDLPFDKLPTREELEGRVKAAQAANASSGVKRLATHARHMLRRLNRGEPLPAALSYPITTWAFADDLAMVFLPGEVVVDYALRLKRELDGSRLWVTAYANDVPCYIASERILNEGGYEADSSMLSYGQPTRLAPAAEDRIIDAVRALLAPGFCPRVDAGAAKSADSPSHDLQMKLPLATLSAAQTLTSVGDAR